MEMGMNTTMTEARMKMLAEQATKELHGKAPDWRVIAFRAGRIGVRELRRTFGADLGAASAYAASLVGVDGVEMAQIDLANAIDDSYAFAEVRNSPQA